MLLRSEEVRVQTKPELSPDVLLKACEEAAEKEHRGALADLVKKIDWQERNAEELRRVIELSLSLEMVRLARELAALGRRLFPDDKKIERIDYVIASPQVIGTRPAQDLKLKASKKWLVENASNYRGQWVAVREGNFLNSAPTLKKLHQLIGPENRTPNTLVVKVSL